METSASRGMPAGAARKRTGRLSPARHTARGAAQERGHQRLCHLQAHELRARGPDRAAHGEIAVPRFDANHEEVRHVDAGDQQHDGRGREEDPQRPRRRTRISSSSGRTTARCRSISRA